MRFRSSRQSSRIASPGGRRRPRARTQIGAGSFGGARSSPCSAPTTFSDGVAGGGSQIKTLRDAVIAANADVGIAIDTIALGAGTYTLSLQQPAAGRENNATAGALAITSTKHEIVVEGQVERTATQRRSSNASSSSTDRVFQIMALRHHGGRLQEPDHRKRPGPRRRLRPPGAETGKDDRRRRRPPRSSGGTVTLINVTLQDNTLPRAVSGVAGAAGVAGTQRLAAGAEPGGVEPAVSGRQRFSAAVGRRAVRGTAEPSSSGERYLRHAR